MEPQRSDESLVEVPPGPCGQPPAGDPSLISSVAVAASTAARDAVEAGFAELRPAVLDAILRLAEPQETLGRRSFTRNISDNSAHPDRCQKRRTKSSTKSGEETARCALNITDPAEDAYMSPWSSERGSACSARLSLSPTVTSYSLGRPTIQSLQADIAMSVLDGSRYGALVRRTSSGASQRQRSGADEERPSLEAAIIVPEAASRLVARVAQVPAAGSSAQGGSEPLPNQVNLVVPDVQGDAGSVGDTPLSRSMRRAASHTPRPLYRHLTGSQLLQTHLADLAREATQETLVVPDASHTSVAPASVALRLVGLLRWEAARFPCLPKAYQAIARIGVALPAVAFFLLALLPALAPTSFADGYRERCDASTCWRHVFLSQLPLPIGAVLVLMPLGCRRDQQRLEESLTLVRGLSVERGYGIVEARRRRFDSLVYILMCLGSMAAAGAGDGFAPSAAMRAFHASAIGVFSAVILCLSYAIVCICRSLIVMVDAFCCDVVGAMPLENVAHFWNLTQAVQRKTSVDVEKCLLALCGTLALSIPLLVVDVALLGARTAHLLPGFLVSCGIIYVLLVAATVSEKRVPAFVNAVSFGPGTERARQHTVDYIASSAAGFYVLDTRLTTAMVVKMTYIWCIVVVAAFTRLAGSSP